jgi:hypothetical protein
VLRYIELVALIDMAAIRASTNGPKPSPEMTLLLALVMFDGYELFPAHPVPANPDEPPRSQPES